MKAVSISILLLSSSLIAQTHQDSIYIETEGTISEILQEPTEELDNSDLYNEIEEFINNPVNINEADLVELQTIPFMDISTAKTIIGYRNKSGHFFSIQELNSIKELSEEQIKKITPFLTVYEDRIQNKALDNSAKTNSFARLRSRVQDEMQDRKGFSENKFNGSKFKLYNKITAGYKNFELGLLTEKDPGENSFYDFSSYYVSAKKIGFINHFVLGDFIIEAGQGLILWSPYGFSKGADAIFPLKKKGNSIKRYSSSTENNFFRGAALNAVFTDFSLTLFYSNNKFDANIDSISGLISSTPIDGLHRTDSEMNKRKSAHERVLGSILSYSNNFVNTGIIFYNSSFSNPFQPASVFDLQGDNFTYISFFYDLYFDKISLFGEAAYDGNSVSAINGLQIPITKNFAFASSIRSYSKSFRNFHGYAFGENSGSGKNEFGIYSGIKWNTSIGIVNFYYDQFKFPYAAYRIPLPSTGDEILLDYKAKPLKNLDARLRFKYEKKEITTDGEIVHELTDRIKKIYMIELKYTINKQIQMKGKFENNLVNYNTADERGYLISQGLNFNPSSLFNLLLRIIFFKTDSFNSALYEYENDLPGIMSSTALFGEGLRWYIIARYKPIKNINISFKYSETFKPKEKSLSSGLMEIGGNLDNRMSLQIDLNY